MFSKFFLSKQLRATIFSNISNRKRHILSMETAYLKRLDEKDQFELSFCYKEDEKQTKINKDLNFNRKLSEEIGTFQSRVALRITKELAKKQNKKKKKDNETPIDDNNENLEEISVAVFKNDRLVPDDVFCKDAFVSNAKIRLEINGRKFNVIVNSPWVVSLTLKSSIYANFFTYPAKFEASNIDNNLTEFIWSKSLNKNKWSEPIHNGYIYTPNSTDVGHYLKLTCTPKSDGKIGPSFECISSKTVQQYKNQSFPFEKRHTFTKDKLSGKQFRVVSYNTLAGIYSETDYSKEVFKYCPLEALNIDYRIPLLLNEIIGYNADIICLQEVDRSTFKHDFNPCLSHLGYTGAISLKGTSGEGLAFFYNKNRFTLLESSQILFADVIDTDPLFADIWNRIKENSNLMKRIKGRSTTLQLNLIQSLDCDEEVLLVANTHYYFRAEADNIRLLHSCIAIKYLEHIVEQTKEKFNGKRVSLIFCGDFNSVPECGMYKLYTTGTVPGNFPDYNSNKEETIEMIDIQQPFKLASACGTPTYTNYTEEFAGCLDYIFYEKTNLEITQTIPLPSHEDIVENTALPSAVFPSDHISLVTDLSWL